MNWFYQLQDVNPTDVALIHSDIKVIDPFNDNMQRWSLSEVAFMRAFPYTKMLAYLSIGEAEDYREYWEKSWNDGYRPKWLDEENPDWPGNFKVKYWHPEWQHLMLKQIDKIIDQGFDGVYLDTIDAYEYYEGQIKDSARDMVDFVKAIAAYARRRRPGFWIVPQNGEGLLHSSAYVDTINAIGKEDVWYGQIDDGVEVMAEETAAIMRDLNFAKVVSKPVLFVEYGLSPRQKTKVRKAASDLPAHAVYFTDRGLGIASAVE